VEPGAAVSFQARSRPPTGRGRLRAEWQLSTPLVAFGDPDASGWIDSGVPTTSSPVVSGADALPFSDGRHRWRMRIATGNPFVPWTPWLTDARTTPTLWATATRGAATDVPSAAVVAASTALAYAGPNPFQGSTTVALSLNAPGLVQLDVVDVAGRRVTTLASGLLGAGVHPFRWDGRNAQGRAVAAGVYFVRMQRDGERAALPVTYLRR
jgi:hypothetical protein